MRTIVEDEYVTTPRTEPEIEAAVAEFHDRVWYERKLLSTPDELRARGVPEDIIEGMLAGMRRVEQQYGKEALGPVSDFEWG